MTQDEARQQITSLWMDWLAARERTTPSQDMLVFYSQLQKQHPEVLSFRVAGDRWQTVKSWIQDRY
ncbi:hypothetical protein [Paracidovorax anthurii]|uniref:Uncharacterized protein n=1 Tax=Paracidovorax anthurii TaxID=78229 RepID=A0A328ZI32_9BURK|nr:hypothetical protein [Paracidovorax anthurii]RAR85005.1 hypothetical protein AX018_100898 [Paracidovorax anthurii]